MDVVPLVEACAAAAAVPAVKVLAYSINAFLLRTAVKGKGWVSTGPGASLVAI